MGTTKIIIIKTIDTISPNWIIKYIKLIQITRNEFWLQSFRVANKKNSFLIFILFDDSNYFESTKFTNFISNESSHKMKLCKCIIYVDLELFPKEEDIWFYASVLYYSLLLSEIV